MSTESIAHADVLIIGGGLVGSSLALALSQAGIAATLVEARQGTAALADPDRDRYLALALGSINALRALGVWADIEPHAAAIRAVHVSRRGDFGRLLLQAQAHGVERFGAVIPASRLGLALEAALQRAQGLRRIVPALLAHVDPRPEHVGATLAVDGARVRIEAKVLIGADGAQSKVRQLAGLHAEEHAYGQDALVHSIALGREHDGVAYERFTGEGAIAFLPLPGRRAGVVWTLPHERAQALADLPEHERMAALQQAFGYRLGRLHSPGRLVRYPLSRSFAPRTCHGRIALVGNAAQSLHPVAAQGFNLGLRDALVLAEEIARTRVGAAAPAAAMTKANDPVDALRRYATRRRPDRKRIAALSDRLARWPKLGAPGFGLARSLGFGVLNASSSLRDSLVLAAMGFGEDTPELVLEPAA